MNGTMSRQLGSSLSGPDWLQVVANHRRLQERNASHRRFGYDPDAGVRFMLEKALPLRGAVLDVGTGKGRFVVALARHVARITTVDVSAAEQHFARLESRHEGVADRIEFVVADARRLPWRAGSFDAVVSWNVVHHLDDPQRVFGELLRVLKPEGKLVLADFSSSGFRLMDAIHRAEGKRHPHPPSQFTHWRANLRTRGFEVRRFVNHHQEVLVANRFVSRPAGHVTRSANAGAYQGTRFFRLPASRKSSLGGFSYQTPSK